VPEFRRQLARIGPDFRATVLGEIAHGGAGQGNREIQQSVQCPVVVTVSRAQQARGVVRELYPRLVLLAGVTVDVVEIPGGRSHRARIIGVLRCRHRPIPGERDQFARRLEREEQLRQVINLRLRGEQSAPLPAVDCAHRDTHVMQETWQQARDGAAVPAGAVPQLSRLRHASQQARHVNRAVHAGHWIAGQGTRHIGQLLMGRAAECGR
jgi:hypothetical protein